MAGSIANVSLSYSLEDRVAVEPIRNAFWNAGFRTHFDVESIGDAGFAEQLKRELEWAECIVVFWSNSAAKSKWAEEGIRHAIRAWSAGRLLLAALDDTPLPVGLRDFSPVAVGDGSDSAVAQLIERAKAIVASGAGDAAEQLVEPPAAAAVVGATIESVPRFAAWPLARIFGAVSNVGFAGLAILGVTALAASLLSPKRLTELPVELRFPLAPGPPQAPTAPLFPIVLGMLVLGVVIGAGAVWVWTVRPRASAKISPIMTMVPTAPADGRLQVFVSYSHEDMNVVDRLVEQIEDMGYPVWIDRQAAGSQRYAAPIVGAIRRSKLVALMCSRNAFSSDHVIREIYVAGDFKKPFISFQLDLTEFPDDVIYFVSGFPRIPISKVNSQQLRSEITRLVAER
jgi:hypothetical protein